ncbi:hypothetical protein GIB67_026880 [Kingdonia uniflora]|uniref:O-acyltransferase WSD1 C-terminal domain-containing protein n=1 Tax=Kingdonia uniflora TaxID=39325 RepID=A0A7J7M7V2_9MAGN|nr:hypothetical protein GIB67_026880 [Kingdonia uniflora]
MHELGTPGVEFSLKYIVHRTVSLDDIRLIKNATDLTMNDVVVGFSVPALSRYINRRYGKFSSFPCFSSSFLSMLSTFKVQTDIAKSTIDRRKNSYGVVCTGSIFALIYKIFGFMATAALFYKCLSRTTVCFSNLVGPLEHFSFCGHPISYIFPTSYGHPEVSYIYKPLAIVLWLIVEYLLQSDEALSYEYKILLSTYCFSFFLQAVMIHYFSYVNKMTIILAVDEDVIPDPYQLFDDIEESLKLMKNDVLAGE